MKPKKMYKPKRRTDPEQLDYYIKNVRRENKTQIIEEQNEIHETVQNFIKERRF